MALLASLQLGDNDNKRYTKEPYGIAFRKGTESTRVLNLVNDMILSMKDSGELMKLQNKWIR